MPTFIPRLEALEDRTVLAAIIVNPVPGVGNFTTIQDAVNAANPAGGDTILIDPATYSEQVKINTSLTIEGNGAGAIIQAPSMLTTSLGQTALVQIGGGATVNMSNLTLEGPGPSTGIYVVGGATANVTGTTIDKMRQDPLNGVQTGRGILVGSTGQSQVGHATITDCTITDYQKSGIVTGGTGTTVIITGTTVTGVGPTTLIAQNGIQITEGTTAQVSNNTVTGNEFTGTNSGPDPTANVQSVGILIFGGSSFTGNTVSGNDVGIDNLATGTAISGNTAQANRFVGILLRSGTAAVSNNTVTGNNIGVAVVAKAGDAVNAQGTLISNNITNDGNGGVAFPGGGIRLLVGSGATTTALATANFNRIVGNSVGLNNTTAAAVDATNNWWGSNAGPGGAGSDTVSGPVTFNPWLVLQVTATPTSVQPGGVATVVADLTRNSNGTDTSALGHMPNGVSVAFAATSGVVAPVTGVTAAGKAMTQFTAGSAPGTATVLATVDNQTSTATITVNPTPPLPSPPPPSPPPPANPPARHCLPALHLYVDAAFVGFFFPFAFIPSFRPLLTNLQDQIQSNPLHGTLLGNLVFIAGFDKGVSILEQQLSILEQQLQPPPP
jgi:parallel beta-helix repeat protein